MTNALRSQIESFATEFTSEILKAIRSASLEDILFETRDGGAAKAPSPRRGRGRPPKAHVTAPTTIATKAPHSSAPAATAKRAKSGRLHRRSPSDIARALAQVVALVKSSKAGLRAEQIRAQLKMQAKEMPRVLKEGLAKKALKSKGQKRATTYTAA
jgi:hypothetical protein